MSLKGTRLRIMELYRRKAEVFRSQEEEPFLRKRLSRYCIIVETFRAVVEGVKLQRRVAECAGLGST